MSDTIEYEKKQLEILYQELTGKSMKLCVYWKPSIIGVVYGVMHNGSCF